MSGPRIKVRRALGQCLVQKPGFAGMLDLINPKAEMRQITGWQWRCTECVTYDQFERIVWNTTATQQGALREGHQHLHDKHPLTTWAAGGNVYRFEAVDGPEAYVPLPRVYCRTHGVKHSCSLTRGARSDSDAEKASVDPEPENGPENGPDDFRTRAMQNGINRALARMDDAMDRYATHDNPLQTAHNESREGA